MQRIRWALLVILFLVVAQKTVAQDDQDKYITRLRISQAVAGMETSSMSAGSFFLYGQGQIDNRDYPAAAHFFKDVLHKDPVNACANYQLAICVIRQNTPVNGKSVQDYLAKALAVYPILKERFARDSGSTGVEAIATGLQSGEKTILAKEQAGSHRTVEYSPAIVRPLVALRQGDCSFATDRSSLFDFKSNPGKKFDDFRDPARFFAGE